MTINTIINISSDISTFQKHKITNNEIIEFSENVLKSIRQISYFVNSLQENINKIILIAQQEREKIPFKNKADKILTSIFDKSDALLDLIKAKKNIP